MYEKKTQAAAAKVILFQRNKTRYASSTQEGYKNADTSAVSAEGKRENFLLDRKKLETLKSYSFRYSFSLPPLGLRLLPSLVYKIASVSAVQRDRPPAKFLRLSRVHKLRSAIILSM